MGFYWLVFSSLVFRLTRRLALAGGESLPPQYRNFVPGANGTRGILSGGRGMSSTIEILVPMFDVLIAH